MLTDFSQSGLLDESLALLDALGPSKGAASSERWWQPTARLQLHDELFRYFLALPQYAVGAVDYTDAPRIALEACLSSNAANAEPPRGKPPKPPLSRPVALNLVEGARANLRQLVMLPKIQSALVDTFGAAIVNAPAGFGGKSTDRPAVLLSNAFNERLGLTSPGRYAIPAYPPGTREFVTHLNVADQIEQLLGQDLPFSSWGVSLPGQITDLWRNLDAVDAWLIDGLQLRGALRQDTATLPLSIWGLAFSFTARAYLADFLCSFARVALPLDRLFEETRSGSKTNVSLDSNGRSGSPVLTKRAYNSYTAIGLVELLTGSAMPHLDSPPGDGYLENRGSLRTLGALDPFDAFWRGDSAVTHALVISELRAAFDKPVLRFQYDPGRNVKTRVAIAPMTLGELRQRMLSHALPSILPASKPAPKPTSKKKQKASKPDRGPFKRCGHFIAHLKLTAAKQLAMMLAANTHAANTTLPSSGAAYIRVGSGSERWGGNHPPHYEHRDGFTFDISILNPYLPWATGNMLESNNSAAQANRKKNRKSVGMAIGVPEPPISAQSYHPLGNPDAVTRDPTLAKAFPDLTAKLLAGQTDVGPLLDIFAGTPVQLGEDGDPDDDLLLPDLIGHVALALVGVRKWIYASFYEHFFALRAIGALFTSSDWLKLLPNETKRLSALIAGAEFYWAPIDHHDHWHVVFNANTNTKISSLGPDAFTVDPDELKAQLSVWTALGVDVSTFAAELDNRKIANQGLFPAALAERKDILGLLEGFLPKSTSTEADNQAKIKQAEFVKVIADVTSKTSYDDIPSLKDAHFQDWVRNSKLAANHPAPPGQLPKNWKLWPSDSAPPELTPDAPEDNDDVGDTP